ncbi:hypothetical protein IEQ34_008043 [Dendrobium chrysotoxum]|uniref:4Fe-4S ferredoxin-type domain-containing protein n=1 Tax=Dendrobium chrysotoxum TaxID=161865 RepID=A0AAV7H4P8_DENCH|nr:hypothetical protein IEQ34_008043 [Dendrobium chrysotoxum]
MQHNLELNRLTSDKTLWIVLYLRSSILKGSYSSLFMDKFSFFYSHWVSKMSLRKWRVEACLSFGFRTCFFFAALSFICEVLWVHMGKQRRSFLGVLDEGAWTIGSELCVIESALQLAPDTVSPHGEVVFVCPLGGPQVSGDHGGTDSAMAFFVPSVTFRFGTDAQVALPESLLVSPPAGGITFGSFTDSAFATIGGPTPAEAVAYSSPEESSRSHATFWTSSCSADSPGTCSSYSCSTCCSDCTDPSAPADSSYPCCCSGRGSSCLGPSFFLQEEGCPDRGSFAFLSSGFSFRLTVSPRDPRADPDTSCSPCSLCSSVTPTPEVVVAPEITTVQGGRFSPLTHSGDEEDIACIASAPPVTTTLPRARIPRDDAARTLSQRIQSIIRLARGQGLRQRYQWRRGQPPRQPVSSVPSVRPQTVAPAVGRPPRRHGRRQHLELTRPQFSSIMVATQQSVVPTGSRHSGRVWRRRQADSPVEAVQPVQIVGKLETVVPSGSETVVPSGS